MNNGRASHVPPAALAPTSPWWGEQRSRYHFAATRVRGRRVLDVACGSGFGSEILADAGARFVVGAEPALDRDGVSPRARREELVFLGADGSMLPFRDASFDVVTSFDGIEHVKDEHAFIRDLRRVLAFGGSLLLSTSNALRTLRANGRPEHPPLLRSFEPDALRALLQEHFREVALLGQVTKDYYPVSPQWEDARAVPAGTRARIHTFVWTLQNRLPFDLKDSVSRFIHNRAFFPGEFDFDFLPEQVERGHVTVAVCSV